MKRFILMVICIVLMGMSYSGFQGQSIRCALVSPIDKKVFIVGTDHSLYECRKGEHDSCRRAKGYPTEKCGVRRLLSVATGDPGVYAATEKGLFFLDAATGLANPIYRSSKPSQKDCFSIAVLKTGEVFLGTGAGLWMNNGASKGWNKIESPFRDQRVVALHARESVIYAAVLSVAYRSDDKGKTWEEVRRVIADKEVIEPEIEAVELSLEEGARIVDLAGSPSDENHVFVVTSRGIDETKDGGKSWQPMPLARLDYKNVRRAKYHEQTDTLYVLTKNALFKHTGGAWSKCRGLRDGQDIVLEDDQMIIAIKEEVISYELTAATGPSVDDEELALYDALSYFDDEPTVRDVQEMAIVYSDTSDKKIQDWRRRADFKAVLPKVSLSSDRSVYGSSSGAFAVGPQDYGVTVSWELGDLIFNSDQTSIDTRSKLMVEMRNDILSEVTRLYFERRKVQVDLLDTKGMSQKELLDKKLRLLELTGLLDRMTNGQFSGFLEKR